MLRFWENRVWREIYQDPRQFLKNIQSLFFRNNGKNFILHLFLRISWYQSTLDKFFTSIFSETKAIKWFFTRLYKTPCILWQIHQERDRELKLRPPFWANKLTISLNGIPVLWRTRVYVGYSRRFHVNYWNDRATKLNYLPFAANYRHRFSDLRNVTAREEFGQCFVPPKWELLARAFIRLFPREVTILSRDVSRGN